MAWKSTTIPSPANIRKRIDAAREAIQGAHTLCKAAGITNLDAPLVNADSWLQDARRRPIKRKAAK